MSSTGKNLKALDDAVNQHAANCQASLLEIRMCPFEVERLDFDSFRGVPIIPDEKMQTGRFRLVCEGKHDGTPAPGVEVGQPTREPMKVGERIEA